MFPNRNSSGRKKTTTSFIMPIWKNYPLLLVCAWFCLFHSSSTFFSPSILAVVQAQESTTEVKWTPNEDAEAPLPLSQNQRQQLYQLEQTIRQSPDPQGTLVQAAQANNMDPNDLLNLLQRNHQAMVEAGDIPAGGGGGGRRSVNILWKGLSSLTVLLSTAAKSNPKAFSMATCALILVLYMSIMAPRTGLVVSSNRGIISKGATTFFVPPQTYLNRVLDSTKIIQKDPTYKQSFPLVSLFDNLNEEDGVVLHKLNKESKKLFKQAVSAQVTIGTASSSNDDDEEEEDSGNDDELQDIYFSFAQRVLDEGELTEWVEPKDSIRMIHSDENAVLVVKGMGDLSRYGLLFLRPVERKETMDKIEVVYSTLRGSHFDGQLHIEVEKSSSSGSGGVKLSVHLIVPKKGRSISKGLAKNIVQSISDSMARSIQTRSEQALARRSQSARYQGNAKSRAKDRRQTRYKKEKEIEEMAVERRRRWQRKNPNSGSYRPSNIRQQSPNNC